jgi:hypothetical protein
MVGFGCALGLEPVESVRRSNGEHQQRSVNEREWDQQNSQHRRPPNCASVECSAVPRLRNLDQRRLDVELSEFSVATIAALPSVFAYGPADWITQAWHRSVADEWCCGERDCFVVMAVATVTPLAPDYRLPDGEVVLQGEASPCPTVSELAFECVVANVTSAEHLLLATSGARPRSD